MKCLNKTGIGWTVSQSREHFQTLEQDYSKFSKSGFYPSNRLDRALANNLIKGHLPIKRLLACNICIRRNAQEVFADVIVEYRRRMRKQGYQFYTFTIIDGRHYTGAVKTYINIPDIKRVTRQVLNKVNPVGFLGVVELQMMTNKDHIVDGHNHGKLICPHTHGGFWTKQKINPDELSKKLSAPFPDLIGGVQPVKIAPWDDTREGTYHWVCYMLKSPIDLKRYWKMKDAKDLIKVAKKEYKRSEEIRSEYKKLRHFQRYMRRLVEIESHIELDNLIFSMADGVQLRSSCLKALKSKMAALAPLPSYKAKPQFISEDYSQEALQCLWVREKRDKRATFFEPPMVIAT